jgi:hypothetical protein
MKPISRRRLLLGAGATAITAPFLNFLNGTARAEGTAAKRLIVFFSPNGTNHERWRPTGSGSSFDFAPNSILEPLKDQKDKLIVCSGIDFKGVANHEAGFAAMLTGGGASTSTQGMSVDQYIASKIGTESRFESLQFGVQSVSAWGVSIQTCMTYGKGGVFIEPDDNPASAFTRMFGDPNASDSEKAKLLVRRQSVLDTVKHDIDALAKRLGKIERDKLQQHLDSIRKVESSLQGSDSCIAPDAPSGDFKSNDAFAAVGAAQLDLMVLALACDMTRVASLQWSHTVGPPVFSWLGLQDGHHSLSHESTGGPKFEDFVKAERWYAERFGELLSKLEATPDPEGGTLLDSTLVVWCKELGDGPSHSCIDVPFVLAGGGYFPLGRHMEFKGAAHQKLLTSICQAMGLNNQSYGDISKGEGPLDGLV